MAFGSPKVDFNDGKIVENPSKWPLDAQKLVFLPEKRVENPLGDDIYVGGATCCGPGKCFHFD